MDRSPDTTGRRSRRGPGGRATHLIALAAVLACCCCRQPPSRPQVAARFIAESPVDIFSTDRISKPIVVAVMPFDPETVAEVWHLDKMEVVHDVTPTSGVVLHAAGQNACFTADVLLEAGTVSAIEVDGEGLVGKSVLFWAAPGQTFSPDRSVTSEGRNPGEAPSFYVADHPQWSGAIGRISIHPTSKPDHTLLVRAVRNLRYEVDPSRLEESALRGWQLTLGDETRPSRIAVEDEPFRWQIDARAGDRLEFAVGVQAGVLTPVEFRVWASGGGLDPALLWERTVSPADGEADAWIAASAPLPVERTETIALDFSVTAADGFDPTRGLPAWGSPIIVRGPAADRSHQPPNIILISIDTLRSDHLSLYGYSRDTSPNLDAWAREHAVVFDSVVASAPWTLPSHISMFSGLDAVTHGVNHGPRPGAVPLVTDQLAAAGFSTVAFTGGGYLDPRFGINAGFDSYRAHSGMSDSSRELEEGLDHLIDWLDHHRDRRFFAFFHTYEVHGPYRPRQPYFGRWSPKDLEGVIDAPTSGFDAEDGYTEHHRLRLKKPGEPPRFLEDDEIQLAVDCYDAGIAFTDAQLQRLLSYLETSGLAATTAIVITSDHGEALGEKGLASHAHLYDFNLLVPLLVSLPGRVDGGRRVTEQVRLVDLAPTILDIAGLSPATPVDGVSLLPLVEGGSAAVPEEAWSYASKTNYGLSLRLGGRLKYIFNNTAWPPAYGREELYRLDGAGGGEDEIVADEADLRVDMQRRARQHLAERQRGITVTIENRTETPLRGRLSVAEKQKLIVSKIKAAGDTGQDVTVVSSQEVGFAVRPGSRLVLITEDIETDRLRITGLPGDPLAGDLDAVLDLRPGRGTNGIVFRDGHWVGLGDPDAQAEAVIRAEWRHRGALRSPTGLEDDPDVVEQLKALGYIGS